MPEWPRPSRGPKDQRAGEQTVLFLADVFQQLDHRYADPLLVARVRDLGSGEKLGERPCVVNERPDLEVPWSG